MEKKGKKYLTQLQFVLSRTVGCIILNYENVSFIIQKGGGITWCPMLHFCSSSVKFMQRLKSIAIYTVSSGSGKFPPY